MAVRRSDAPKNLKNANVKGGMFVKASLNIGAPAPQNILAKRSAMIPYLMKRLQNLE